MVQFIPKSMLKEIPVAASGLMLGLAALGNLLSSYSFMIKIVFGTLSAIIFILLLLKITYYTTAIKEDLKNPAIAGIACTFPMGIVLLANYILPIWPISAYLLCGAGILLHCILIIYFTKNFILKFSIKKVFPSYFVVYVGIAVFSVISPGFNATSLGQLFFIFGFIAYLFLLPIILYRVIVIKSIPDQLLPTTTIFAAPASLCLAGYLNSFQDKNSVVICLLIILSLLMLLGVLLYMPKMLKKEFLPAYSAFTFPFVISATAIKTLNHLLETKHIFMLQYLVYGEELLATCFVIFVLIRYISFYSRSLQY